MFSNILYVVEDDSKYLLMDSVLNRSEALSRAFLNRRQHAEVRGDELGEYDLLIVEYETQDGSPYANGQELIRELKHAGADMPMILIAGLDSMQLDGEIIDWISDQRLTLVDDRRLSEHELVHALVRAIAGISQSVVLDVLVLEPDPDDYQLISYCLAPKGDYRVNAVHATSLDDAEAAIRGRQFDAYLVAHRIGDDNSNALLRELLERAPERPVLLLTNRDTDDVDEELVRMLGRHRYEVLEKKNLSVDSLHAALQRVQEAGRQRHLRAASA